MNHSESIGSVDHPVGMTVGESPPDFSLIGEPIGSGLTQVQQRHGMGRQLQLPRGALRAIESFIQRYPWFTLLLGVSAGYVLARRMR
jgi:hypothetical protein